MVNIKKIKYKDEEYDLELQDALMVMALIDLTIAIDKLRMSIK